MASSMSPEHKQVFDERLKANLAVPENPLCHVCKKGKQDGVKLRVCEKCHLIGRRMLYCSRPVVLLLGIL